MSSFRKVFGCFLSLKRLVLDGPRCVVFFKVDAWFWVKREV